MNIQLSRRNFLFASAALGGGLYLGLSPERADAAEPGQLNAWVVIPATGRIRIMASNPEVGQGIRTSLPMVIAEELDADWAAVEIVPTLADARIYGRQVAGGSQAMPTQYEPMRRVGAAARGMILQAAASAWNVPVAELNTDKGHVVHGTKRAPYGQFAAAAAALPAPDMAGVAVKDPKSFRLIGSFQPGVNNRAIVAGKQDYGIDAVVPGMIHAAFHKSGVQGAKVKSANVAAIKAMGGVKDAFIVAGTDEYEGLASGVAILADTTWHAERARAALKVEWSDSPAAFQSTAAWAKMAADAKGKPPAMPIHASGDVSAAMARATKRVAADYAYPFIPHVPMEPINCTARVDGDKVEIWAPTQNPEPGRAAVAKLLGVPPENVTIHMMRVGGGFGRRLQNDYMVEAVAIAKQAGRPVKLTWTREDDITQDYLRPGGWHYLEAGLDAQGRCIAWDNHFISFGQGGKFARAAGIGPTDFPAGIVEDFRLGATVLPLIHTTGFLRAPANNAFGFVTQGFIDELAHAAGADPVQFRRDFLGAPRIIGDPKSRGPYNTGRMRAVLDKAAAMAGWGRKLPRRTGLGVAFHFSHLGYFANVIEASVATDGTVKVHKVWVAGDIGRQIVNPAGAMNQVQGSILDALGACMGHEITFADGAIEQRNFGDVPMLRNEQIPPIEVAFLTPDYPVTGLGEPAYPAVAPALANAIFAATGVRLRKLPLDLAQLKA
ncbi:molybdopterin cofactor-binding domain-containing protein [Sandarakinorhabdus sp. AAP62]|uniref:xanthine dehydrogenase family protein molybdopterin-binding subunit n=1 Tax=Sandarakinorhabdus sp. AAP62 TaxID=1248916 RepID=UPI0002D58B1A|nr:molybdopterin cofactor-binding domain-containing protein [Sandarakinorhabdus sp. AAP62]